MRHARPGDRARIEHALASASPAATAVPARALLVIRHLRVETPLGRGDDARFARELIDRVRAAKVSAGRGAPNAVGDVYYEDDIALEIALVRAWLAGERLPETLRRAMPDSATPVLRWRRSVLGDGRLLPLLIVALVKAGAAAAWLDRFDDRELVAAADTILHGYGAPIIVRRSPTIPGRGRASRKGVVPPAVPAAIAEPRLIACRATERPGARRLIVVALVAARRPELLASDGLAAALAVLETVAQAAMRPAVRPARSDAVDGFHPPKATPEAVPSACSIHRARPDPPDLPVSPVAPIAPFSAPSPPPVATADPAPVARAIESDFAGIFFLLNVFVVLGLYGNAVDPAGRVRGLSPFALLLLIGRRWFGDAFLTDPIAPTLRDLAGLAPRERLARDFTASEWSAPSAWLTPWPRGRARIVKRAAGTTRWHRAGFPITDRWRIARSPAWLRRRWVACLVSYLKARLARALGVPAKAALRIVGCARGRITIDGDRLDIGFALDDHPLSLRLAGLDRDPGWMPAAGRDIRFHFA